MQKYVTIQGEMVDSICRRFYGDESGYVEAVFEANPGLAAKSDPLPIGTIILLPEITNIQTVNVVALWD